LLRRASAFIVPDEARARYNKRVFDEKECEMSLTRRAFTHAASLTTLAVAGGCVTAAPAAPAAVLDTHVHVYDPARPQGVPWPPPADKLLFRTTLPQDYRALPAPRPADGVIVVEASPWPEDNQWVLELAAREPLIAGVVGNLRPGDPAFAGLLARFAANPLFRGVRTREATLEAGLADQAFMRDLRDIARRGLCFDVHTPPAWVNHAERLAREVPELRLVVNHIAGAAVTGGPPDAAWLRLMDALARRPQVFMKVSGLVEGTRRTAGDAPSDPAFYAPVLDALWERFGADRLLYGSNWPVSGRYAPLATVQSIALAYFSRKGQAALDKVFWQNARAAYGCAPAGRTRI
jgi:predicted TIM-barrel fold metal-dependent hydrolase